MPCYIKVANLLHIHISEKVNHQRLEELLMKYLDVPFNRHDLLLRELNRRYETDPEKLKEILIGAIALAGKKKEFPDRFKDLRRQADKVWKKV